MMKNIKEKLKKFNLVDAGIVVLVLLMVAVAFTRTGGNVQSYTFDGFDIDRAVKKYEELSKQGYIVTGKITGISLGDRKPVDVEGEVTWAGFGMLLMNVGGNNISVGGPISKYEDVYARGIVLEVSKKIKVADVILEPKRITSFNELIPQREDIGDNYKVYTQVAMADADSIKVQEVVSALRTKRKYVAIYPSPSSNIVTLSVEGASREDLKIASDVLGKFDGMSDIVIVRTYGVD